MLDWERTRDSQQDLGTVRIGFSMRKQDALFRSVIWYGAGVTAFLLVVIIPSLGWVLRRLLEPLAELIEFTRRVGSGDLSARARIARPDEVGELTLAFNQMLDQLSSTTVSRDYVDDVLQCMAESLIVVNNEGTIQTVNAATLDMLGYQAREIIGRPAGLVLVSCATRPCQDSVGRVSVMETYLTKNGRQIPVLFSTSPLRSSSAAAQGMVWVAQDMTAMKRVQEDLIVAKEAAEQASEAKSQFLATMTHELRTPLNAILGFSQLLELEMADEGIDRWNKELQKIQRAGDHLLVLINNILDLARIDAGKVRLAKEPFDVVLLSREVIEEMRPLAAANGNELHLAVDVAVAEPAIVRRDGARVRQCLLNLVGNACKFTRNGRVELNVSSSWERGCAVYDLRVIDTGIGIRPDEMNRLFGDFSQVDASKTRKFGGTGLGLSISRKLCRMMGGDITVTSSPGEGSTFTMQLPAGDFDLESPLNPMAGHADCASESRT